MKRIFVYGTLKRGCKNHRHLAGQTYVGEARTVPGFRLYDLGDYPGMAADPTDLEGVTGEVWGIDAATLVRLDAFESIAEGLYRREAVPLEAPFAQVEVHAYIYARPIEGLPEIGATWRE